MFTLYQCGPLAVVVNKLIFIFRFDMIENAEYPSYNDILFLLSKGFDYYNYEEGNVIHKMSGYVPPN